MNLPNYDAYRLDTPPRLDDHPGDPDEDDDDPEPDIGDPVGVEATDSYATDDRRSGLVFHDEPA